jgi:thiamine-phosphate pyrophosphorylase
VASGPEPAGAAFRLTLVTDRRLAPAGLPALARDAARAGVDFIQVREKDLSDRALARLVEEVRMAADSGGRVLVNGRPDVAEALGAAGVQLPEAGLPVGEVRRAFPRLVLGASCHGLESARRAEGDGADFVVLGPIFATPGKEGRALGLPGLERVASAVRIPVHAIGGVGTENVGAVAAAGARGMAAIRVFLTAPADDVVRALRQAAGRRD